MAIHVEIEKSFKGFSLKTAFDSKSSATGILGASGSGKSMISDVLAKGAQVYVTGDIDHHTGIDAVAQGLAIVDAGHYGTEYIFMKAMEKVLKEQYPNLQITCAKVQSPYMIL